MRLVPSDPTEHLWTPVTDGIAGQHLFPNALLNVPQSIALPIVDDHGRCLTIIRPDLGTREGSKHLWFVAGRVTGRDSPCNGAELGGTELSGQQSDYMY